MSRTDWFIIGCIAGIVGAFVACPPIAWGVVAVIGAAFGLAGADTRGG